MEPVATLLAEGPAMVTPKAVYLDQNHWISLARAWVGKEEKSRWALRLATQLSTCRRAIFPISIATAIEIHKIKNARRRRSFAEFVAFLSDGWFLAPWNLLIDAECYNATVEVYDLPHKRVDIFPIDRGIIFLLGSYDRAREDCGLSFEDARELEQRLDSKENLIQFLSGPNEPSASLLRREFREQDETYANAAEQLRRMRLEQVPDELSDYCAAQVFISIYRHILGAHFRLGITQEELLAGGRARMRDIISSIPTALVDWKLSYQRDLQKARTIDPNDQPDLWHLNVAIPYCDLVITERFWTNLVSRTDLPTRFNTTVSASLTALQPLGTHDNL